MKLTSRTFIWSIPVIVMAGMFVSCSSNDIKDIEAIDATDDSPSEVSYDVEMTYTDSGYVRAKLRSPEIQRFAEDETVLYSPRGIHVTFYDSVGTEDSYMSAIRGKFFERQRKVELRDSVVVTNIGGEELQTEFLVWMQDSGFFTDKFVKIIKGRTILTGHGLVADEHFTKYKITKPSGEFENPEWKDEEPADANAEQDVSTEQVH